MGILGWTPDVFWNATFRETMIAVEGVAIAAGAEMPDEKSEKSKAMRRDLEDLMRQYPDG